MKGCLKEPWRYLRVFPELSLTDASIVAAMENLGIRKVCSFDSDFDRIEWVERLE